ncbi:immunity protein TriTu family protein [Arenimonas oryziterrae]|uniref:immunity protein TriTu family protein n=1 Tax=Arenimonas oryziterrae TaxID=498055 RepID=UPI003CCC0079
METASAADTIRKRLAGTFLCRPLSGELDSLSIRSQLTYGDPTANSALRIDLDGTCALGRLTWWSDGSIVLEAIRIRDGSTCFSRSGFALDSSQALVAARELAGVVASVAP